MKSTAIHSFCSVLFCSVPVASAAEPAMSDAADPARSDPSLFTALEEGIPHPTVGCGGAVVLTPRPGTQFADPVGIKPESASSFYAKAASLHVTWLEAMECVPTDLTHVLVPSVRSTGPALASTTKQSENWSGYQIGNTAQFVQSGWTIPNVVKPAPPSYSDSGYDSSIWVGLGGGFNTDRNAPLLQAGSTQRIFTNGTKSYYFWYEIVGGPTNTATICAAGECKVNSPTASPGDDVGVVTLWLQDSGQAEFGICNFTNALCLQFLVPCNSHGCTSMPGTSVEWIVESPKINGALQYLPDFGSVHFYNACWAATYIEGQPVDCRALTESVSAPLLIQLWRKIYGITQLNAYPYGVTGGGIYDEFVQPDNGN